MSKAETNNNTVADKSRTRVGTIVRIAVIFACAAFLALIATVPLSLMGQLYLSGGLFAVGLVLSRYPGSVISLMLMLLSATLSLRYLYWRFTQTLGLDAQDPAWLDLGFGLALAGAELFTVCVVLLGYFQAARPLRRRSTPLPDDEASWPSVDVFIPTYNEPLSVVRRTVLAAQNLDWPADKLSIFLLDDGRRREFESFAREVGVQYITRPDNKHAKAGNLNHAAAQTSGELIAIFDCDHVPVRAFLRLTSGGFLANPKLGFVQTPHYFYTPNPIDRHSVVNFLRRNKTDHDLFHTFVQDCNDTWNAVLFSGSCTVLRRSALNEIGGVAVDTVTEDAHTSLKLLRQGYEGHYLNMALAAGMAPLTVADLIKQRMRWALGMAQIFRLDNPIFGRGLTVAQRVCYLNAMLYFFYGAARMVFLTAPLAFLLLDAHIVQAAATLVAAFVIPHLLHIALANGHVQGAHRQSFWTEVYETLISYYTMLPALIAQLFPRKGSFVVTPKGRQIEQDYFDFKLAKPYLILLVLNGIGLAVGVTHLLQGTAEEAQTLWFCVAWSVYNVTLLGAVTGLAWEHHQGRTDARLPARLPARLDLSDGRSIDVRTHDAHETGAALAVNESVTLPRGEAVTLTFVIDDIEVAIPARVIGLEQNRLRVNFLPLTLAQQRGLNAATFGRREVWHDWASGEKTPNFLVSLIEVIAFGWLSILRLAFAPFSFLLRPVFGPLAARRRAISLVVGTSLIAAILFFSTTGHAATASSDAQPALSLSFATLANASNWQLSQTNPALELSLPVRADRIVTGAQLNLRVRAEAAASSTQLELLVNDVLVRQFAAGDAAGEGLGVTIDTRFLAADNRIVLRLSTNADNNVVAVDEHSDLVLATRAIAIPDDFQLLPLPFFDASSREQPRVNFVLPAQPTASVLQAAGILASWMGTYSRSHRPVVQSYLGNLPAESAVVLALPGTLPPALAPFALSEPGARLLAHPQIPSAKVLLVMADNEADLLRAARALSAPRQPLSGASMNAKGWDLPPTSSPYTVTDWVATDRLVHFSEITTGHPLVVHGVDHDVLRLQFKLPPDLLAWANTGVPLRLDYAYSAAAGGELAMLDINLNGLPLRSLRLNGGAADALLADGEIRNTVQILIPAEDIHQQNELAFYFNFKTSATNNTAQAAKLRAEIGLTSSLDFSKFPHFAALPDLSLFARSGYPYSRYADLQNTAFILPVTPDSATVSAYLTVLSGLGATTASPALYLTLSNPDSPQSFANRDLIVIGTFNNQPLFRNWAPHLPLQQVAVLSNDTGLDALHRIQLLSDRLVAYLDGRDLRAEANTAQQHLASAGEELALLMGFESPVSRGHSVVMLVARDANGLAEAAASLQTPQNVAQLKGDLALIKGAEISSFSSGRRYYVGELSALDKPRWLLAQHPLLLSVCIAITALVSAIGLQRPLSRRTQLRLKKIAA